MMNYCMECGTKLELRHLENEGEIPFCSQCNQFRFPIFNTAVSMICIDVKNQKILLIKQYGRPDYILVAGYISRGEDAEAAVKREVFEETGMTVDRLQFNKTSFFEPSNTLMVNFAISSGLHLMKQEPISRRIHWQRDFCFIIWIIEKNKTGSGDR